MDAARILVIDGDAWIQRTVGTLLVARGHVVERAVDGEEARARVARVVPDLVIVARLLPDGSGEMLIDSLRRGGRLANVPALVLVGAEDTQNDFAPPPAADLDEHLPKPFRLEQFEAALARALDRGRKAAARAASAASAAVDEAAALPSFQGDLAEIGLPTVLLVLDMERKSGVLELEGTPGVAVLALRKGRVVRAELAARGVSCRGAAAVYEAMDWKAGWFSFRSGGVEGPDEIQTATTFLLMEGARRIDEANRPAEDEGL